MTGTDYSQTIDEFDGHVRNHFAYLESEFGFTRNPLRTHDLIEFRDASVSVRYKTAPVSIRIGMSVVGAGIEVVFKNENWVEIPKEKRVKWVSLDSVCAFQSDGKARTLLHELTSPRRKYWPDGFLLENMELVIKTLAFRTREYAADILAGDASSFLETAACTKGSNAT